MTLQRCSQQNRETSQGKQPGLTKNFEGEKKRESPKINSDLINMSNNYKVWTLFGYHFKQTNYTYLYIHKIIRKI